MQNALLTGDQVSRPGRRLRGRRRWYDEVQPGNQSLSGRTHRLRNLIRPNQTNSKWTHPSLNQCAAARGRSRVNTRIHGGELNHQPDHFFGLNLILATHSEQIDFNEPWLFMLSGFGSLAGKMTNAAWVTLRNLGAHELWMFFFSENQQRTMRTYRVRRRHTSLPPSPATSNDFTIALVFA